MSDPAPHAHPDARKVRVVLDAGRSYDVHIGTGILGETRQRLANAITRSSPVFIVHDRSVPRSHLSQLESPVGQAGVSIDVSEEHKSLERTGTVLSAMAHAAVERSHALIALGGGITGDLAGFAAGVYRRGIPWVNCPTTLLAMVDASVGGKTGVNLTLNRAGSREMLKNMVGVFHQPRLVVADVQTLRSLPAKELRAGLAECIKHGLISGDWTDPALLEWTRLNISRILALDEPTLVELVARNVTIKAAVVASDELESGHGPGGGRMALNLGHTFGHALEAIPELGLSHGEAVGLGLLAASACSYAMGLAGTDVQAGVKGLLESIGLPTRIAGLPQTDRILSLMLQDKKVEAGSLRLILPRGGNRVAVFDAPPIEAVRGAIDSIRA